MFSRYAKILTSLTVILSTFLLFAENKETEIFGYQYNPKYTHMNFFEGGEEYEGVPSKFKLDENPYYIQPWSGYTPEFTLEDKNLEKNLPCQTYNIKADYRYIGIEVEYNKWVEMACEEALISAQNKGGPFGAVIVQIDDKTGEVLRYWRNHNHVTEWSDPTAHAEVTTIRAACKELGVINLNNIKKGEAKLSQNGETSHCEIYVNAEPCPMCYAAISWADIPVVVFAATRYDAAAQGVAFDDESMYHNMALPYKERTDREVYQSSCPNSLDAFNFWKRTQGKVAY